MSRFQQSPATFLSKPRHRFMKALLSFCQSGPLTVPKDCFHRPKRPLWVPQRAAFGRKNVHNNLIKAIKPWLSSL